jgi:predicted membrane protein
MEKAMVLATVLVLVIGVVFGMEGLLWACAFGPLLGAAVFVFARCVKWM